MSEEIMESNYGNIFKDAATVEKIRLNLAVPLCWHYDGSEIYNSTEFHCYDYSSALVHNETAVRMAKIFMLMVRHGNCN